MTRVPDRKRLRQEYLRKKGGAYAAATFCRVGFMSAAAIAIGCCGAALVNFQMAITDHGSLAHVGQALEAQERACQVGSSDAPDQPAGRLPESDCYRDAYSAHDQALAHLRDREGGDTRQALTFLILASVAGSGTVGFRMGIRRARRAANIAYIPPVRPDILPADEILVRGSEEPPVVQSTVLVRASQGIETPKEELLRPGNRSGTG